MEKYTMFMDWQNQYSENEYTTQSNLQIQCNPYQATSGIFHRATRNNFTNCMEIQKTSNSQSNLFLKKIYFYFILLYNTVLVLPYIDMNPPRKEEWNWGNQPA